MSGLVILAVVLGAASAVLLMLYLRMTSRYAPILNAEAEAKRILHEVAVTKARETLQIQTEVNRLHREVETERNRAKSLREQYHTNHELFQSLQREVALVQENIEDISFGLYAPHYCFDTSEEFKASLERVYGQKKDLIRSGQAAICPTAWTVNNSKREGEKMIKQYSKVMLRAFNGECDSALARISWNNATRMEERIRKAFEAINALGTVNNIQITRPYLDLCLAELRLTHEYEVKKQEEKEEQRRIREQMREEERAQKEFEKAQRDAVVESERYEKALAAARLEVSKATGDALAKAQAKVDDLETKLTEAQAKMQRAMSMAQLTKMGHVYVISNIGSFGEDVLKIGMTRRLEPTERVNELGDASVPFTFDIHAMIFSDDAPALERAFHCHFGERRLNLVNMRKEFFRIGLSEIEDFAKSQGVTVEFTHLAEARQYRETLAMREKAAVGGSLPPLPEPEGLPNELVFTEED